MDNHFSISGENYKAMLIQSKRQGFFNGFMAGLFAAILAFSILFTLILSVLP